MADPALLRQTQAPQSLTDVLDSLLDTGAVLDGHIVLSVAGVDLVFVGLRALIASTDSAARLLYPAKAAAPQAGAP